MTYTYDHTRFKDLVQEDANVFFKSLITKQELMLDILQYAIHSENSANQVTKQIDAAKLLAPSVDYSPYKTMINKVRIAFENQTVIEPKTNKPYTFDNIQLLDVAKAYKEILSTKNKAEPKTAREKEIQALLGVACLSPDIDTIGHKSANSLLKAAKASPTAQATIDKIIQRHDNKALFESFPDLTTDNKTQVSIRVSQYLIELKALDSELFDAVIDKAMFKPKVSSALGQALAIAQEKRAA